MSSEPKPKLHFHTLALHCCLWSWYGPIHVECKIILLKWKWGSLCSKCPTLVRTLHIQSSYICRVWLRAVKVFLSFLFKAKRVKLHRCWHRRRAVLLFWFGKLYYLSEEQLVALSAVLSENVTLGCPTAWTFTHSITRKCDSAKSGAEVSD